MLFSSPSAWKKANFFGILKNLLACLLEISSIWWPFWQYTFPNEKRYSWRQFGGIKRARLDFFLVSSTLIPFVGKCDIIPGIHSDHSMPTLDIDFSRFVRGRGFFKFNNSLLTDSEYVKLIRETIQKVISLGGVWGDVFH